MRTQDSLRRAVADAAQAMQSVRGREQSMQVAADAVRHLIDGCDVAAISVLTGEALRTVICSSAGGDDVRERVQEVDDLQYELAEGPCHQSMTLGDTVHSADMAHDDRWGRWAPVAVDRLGSRSVVSHPLTMAGRVLGVLKVYGTRRSAFTSDDIEQVATFAVHVSVALAAARDVEHLTDALDSRTLIGQATGLLMARYDLGPDAAFAVLARTSQTENVKVRDLAEQIVRTRELPAI